ncbi:MAG TPA: sigma-70 family RNA polymerase sigma factor [Thermoanaerobaculia bacterium]|nr:sigma-70 family RNA polymerase sigma factor [Thermoanaerobaculia bacterium]
MDETRFQQLLRSHARLMAGAIRKVCGRRHRALVPDVEQEVYLALWKRLGQDAGAGKEIAHPVSYLYKTALTTAAAMVRKLAPGGVDEARDESVELEGLAAPEDAGLGGLSAAERERLLAELLARLPDEQARALRAYLAGFNHEEVAGLYGWTESVARHRIYRAIETLKAEMAREALPGGTGRRKRRDG